MGKFEKGDVVIRTGHSYSDGRVIKGNTYIVHSIPDKYRLRLEGVFNEVGYLDWFDKNEFELVEKKQPTSYREMNPDSTVKVKIGDYESEVCLGDLVHATALLGVTNGYYGADLWKFLKNTLGEYSFEEDIDTIIEFREKQKRSLEYFFKPFYDKQNEKEVLLKDIEEQKAILKNQQEFLKELEDKYNSL